MQVRAIAEAAAERRRPGGDPRAGDHGAAGRRRAGARDRPRGGRADPRRGRASETGSRPRHPDRHDDRGAAGRAHRRPDRRGGRVLLLRHQRPDPDGLGLLPRRRRGARSSRRYLELGIFGVSPVRDARPRRRRRGWCGSPSRRAARPGPTSSSASAASTAATPTSVHFFHEVGLDYVSCSPFRVPVARLEAGRAALDGGGQRQPLSVVDRCSGWPLKSAGGPARARPARARASPPAGSGGSPARTTGRASDAIVVLGAAQFDGRPSSVFTARLVHARDLYDGRRRAADHHGRRQPRRATGSPRRRPARTGCASTACRPTRSSPSAPAATRCSSVRAVEPSR